MYIGAATWHKSISEYNEVYVRRVHTSIIVYQMLHYKHVYWLVLVQLLWPFLQTLVNKQFQKYFFQLELFAQPSRFLSLHL